MAIEQIDLRKMISEEHQVVVFRAFDSLAKGEAFTFVADQDPTPLFRQFKMQRPGAFLWEYTERGPHAWQVRIAKTSDGPSEGKSEEGCCGICGPN